MEVIVMAIYHFDLQLIKRKDGRSTVNAAAYRAGEKIKDERLNKTFNYNNKMVHESFIMKPKNTPDWVGDRATLWNEIERIEKRKDAQLAREINVALPVELSDSNQTELIKKYVQENFVDEGMIADVCIHKDNPENPHAHIMLTMREFDSKKNGFGNKNRDWNEQSLIHKWRENWATVTNESLKENGINQKIDHRSHAERGITLLPQIHEGPNARDMHKRGKFSERVSQNEEIKKINESIISLEKELEATKKEFDEIVNSNKMPKIFSLRELVYETDAELKAIEQRKNNIKFNIKEFQTLPEKIEKDKEKLKKIEPKYPIFNLFKSKKDKQSLNDFKAQIREDEKRLEYIKKQDLNKLRTEFNSLIEQENNLKQKRSKAKEQIQQIKLQEMDKSKSKFKKTELDF